MKILGIFEEALRIAKEVEDGKLELPAVITALQAIKTEPEDKPQTQITEPTITNYKLVVNYDLKLEEMIKAGKYDWLNDNITGKNFPVAGKGKVELNLKLVHFNRNISSDDAITEMAKLGLRPANPAEILKLGETHPDLQKEFPIAALGQTWAVPDDRRFVVGLHWSGGRRLLRLGRFGVGWPDDWRFLAVGK